MHAFLCKISAIAFLFSCQSQSNIQTVIEPIQQGVMAGHGPYSYKIRSDISFRLKHQPQILADLVTTSRAGSSPLVIISHGNHSHKEAHRFQAQRLATWGFNALTIQLPNRKRWLANGRTIAALVNFLQANEEKVSNKIKSQEIILAGHSFGGSAVAIAASSQVSILGLILLDPALVHDRVKDALRQVKVPVMIIGADRKIYKARRRAEFFKLPRQTLEFSVVGATHDDAQNPSMFSLYSMGVDPFTSRPHQNFITAALTSGAQSLATTGNFSTTLELMKQRLVKGEIKGLRRKLGRTVTNFRQKQRNRT